MNDIGAMIGRARADAGLSQAELARRMRTTQSAIARLESGGTSPRLDTLERALAACGKRLELRAVPAEGSSIDETLVAEQLRMPPAERLRSFERSYADIRRIALAGQAAHGRLA
jgi:transcriptional regulator with XRE-family HTH domain